MIWNPLPVGGRRAPPSVWPHTAGIAACTGSVSGVARVAARLGREGDGGSGFAGGAAGSGEDLAALPDDLAAIDEDGAFVGLVAEKNSWIRTTLIL